MANYYVTVGSEVILTARTEEKLALICNDLNLRGVAYAYPGDVTNSEQMRGIVDDLSSRSILPELVILNAGTYFPLSLSQYSPDRIRDLMEVNYFGVVNILDTILPLYRDLKRGQIAVVSSLAAEVGLPFSGPYSASKAALLRLCESLRAELANSGVSICTVLPGFVKTPLTDKNEFNMPFMVSAEKAAKIIALGLSRDKVTIRFPWQMSIIMKVLSLLPGRIFSALTRRMVA